MLKNILPCGFQIICAHVFLGSYKKIIKNTEISENIFYYQQVLKLKKKKITIDLKTKNDPSTVSHKT